MIDQNFKDYFLPIDYDSIKEGAELDIKEGIYNDWRLSREQVLEHPGWQTALEGDLDLLEAYSKIVFTELKSQYSLDKRMGFYVRQNTEQDQLRPVYVNVRGNGGNADGDSSFSNVARLLRVAHS